MEDGRLDAIAAAIEGSRAARAGDGDLTAAWDQLRAAGRELSYLRRSDARWSGIEPRVTRRLAELREAYRRERRSMRAALGLNAARGSEAAPRRSEPVEAWTVPDELVRATQDALAYAERAADYAVGRTGHARWLPRWKEEEVAELRPWQPQPRRALRELEGLYGPLTRWHRRVRRWPQGFQDRSIAIGDGRVALSTWVAQAAKAARSVLRRLRRLASKPKFGQRKVDEALYVVVQAQALRRQLAWQSRDAHDAAEIKRMLRTVNAASRRLRIVLARARWAPHAYSKTKLERWEEELADLQRHRRALRRLLRSPRTRIESKPGALPDLSDAIRKDRRERTFLVRADRLARAERARVRALRKASPEATTEDEIEVLEEYGFDLAWEALGRRYGIDHGGGGADGIRAVANTLWGERAWEFGLISQKGSRRRR